MHHMETDLEVIDIAHTIVTDGRTLWEFPSPGMNLIRNEHLSVGQFWNLLEDQIDPIEPQFRVVLVTVGNTDLLRACTNIDPELLQLDTSVLGELVAEPITRALWDLRDNLQSLATFSMTAPLLPVGHLTTTRWNDQRRIRVHQQALIIINREIGRINQKVGAPMVDLGFPSYQRESIPRRLRFEPDGHTPSPRYARRIRRELLQAYEQYSKQIYLALLLLSTSSSEQYSTCMARTAGQTL